ncbi:hypothetical protein CLIM01_12715 [Colletotrichum limetticola]|uniref:Secreted protein n=1 Tax=Colletotrichum limetticola TaxID=1209924 RepID=A0ABQ9PCW4_9PEZI|nr:hypothetical protein CLIM01_12715 [Colletotrichum limetticola]
MGCCRLRPRRSGSTAGITTRSRRELAVSFWAIATFLAFRGGLRKCGQSTYICRGEARFCRLRRGNCHLDGKKKWA